ncbi:MAG: mechanosensitive ion channel family protein [Dehalococcoidia bacterium]
MEVSWDGFIEWMLVHGSRIGLIIALGLAGWFILVKFIRPIVRKAVADNSIGESAHGVEKRSETLSKVFVGVGKTIIVLVVLFMILDELGVPVGPMLAGFGIAGLAVGFGAQYLIRDLIAGSFIIMENQYRVGDWARINDVHGEVEEVNLRRTVLRDLDGLVHHIPNGTINVASNATRHFARVNFNVRVAYNTELDSAISVINRIGNELASDEKWRGKLITTPQVRRINDLSDSGIEIKIVGDVDAGEQWGVAGELRLRLKKAFDEVGIEIPWSYSKIYFGNALEMQTEAHQV